MDQQHNCRHQQLHQLIDQQAEKRPTPTRGVVGAREKGKATNLICRVCGDNALGYHFNALTCESCKAFFRRNALKKKNELLCPSRNNCNITISSRRFCQKCRMRKCLQVGMKAEYIMSDEQRAEKRRRLQARAAAAAAEGNVMKRQQLVDGMNSSAAGSASAAGGGSEMADEEDNNGEWWWSEEHEEEEVASRSDHYPRTETSRNNSVISSSSSSNNNDDSSTTTTSPVIFPDKGTTQSALRVVENGPEKFIQLTIQAPLAQITPSSSAAAPLYPEIPGGFSEEDVEIRIRVPKFQLLNVMLNNQNNNDQQQQGVLLPGGMVTAVRMTMASSNDSNQSAHNMGPAAGASAVDCGSDANDCTDYRPAVLNSTISRSSTDIVESLLADLDDHILLPPPLSPNAFVLDLKLAKLEELHISKQIWSNLYSDPISPNAGFDINFDDFYKMVSYHARGVVAQFSQLSAFSQLPVAVKQALIKRNTTQLCTLCTVQTYDRITDCFVNKYPGQQFITCRISNRFRGGVYKEQKEMITSFLDKWRYDDSLMLILNGIAMFSHHHTELSNYRSVEDIRLVYLQLLKDYLDNKYGHREGRWAYEYLREKMEYLSTYGFKYAPEVVIEFNPNTLDIVLLNIFQFR